MKSLQGNGPHRHRPLLVVLSVGIAGMVMVALLAEGAGERISILQADFDTSNLQPGGSTSLTIRIKNTSSTTDAHDISVTVTPSDPTAVQVENGEAAIDILGAGEERVVEFLVSVSQDSLPGTYKLKISTSASEIEGENRDLYLEVAAT